MKTKDPFHLLLHLLFALLFLLLSAELYSQETATCAEKLQNAQSYFEKGQVDSVPGLLTDCLKTGFKKEEALTAYKLIIQTFLLNDKIAEADSSMYAFLKKYPEYQLSPTDHSSFVYLCNNFIVKPVLQLGIHAGTSIPFLTFLDENPTAGEPVKSDYGTNAANLYISLEAKFKIGKKLELGVETGYSQLKFTNTVNYLGFGIIKYIESQQRLEIPLSVSYDIKSFGKFTPYARTGIGAAFNLSTSADVSFNVTDKNNPNPRTGETLDRKDSRPLIDIFGQVGAGVKYKIPRGFFFTEIRSNFGIINQNVHGGATVDLGDFYYLWSDPDFRINSLNFNFGYTFIFYKPSKKSIR